MSAIPAAQPESRRRDRRRLSPALAALDGLVDELIENQRRIAALEARRLELFAAAVDVIGARADELRERKGRRIASDLPVREVTAELACALRIGERTVHTRLGDGAAATGTFPAALDALREGRIDGRHLAVILDAGSLLSRSEDRRRFERAVLPIAETETAGRLRPYARRIAAGLDPDAAAHRAAEAQFRRRVTIQDLDDDLARLILDLPATLAHAVYDRLTQQARAVQHGTSAAAPEAGNDAEEAHPDPDDDRVVVRTGARPRPGNTDPDADEPADPRSLDEIRADIVADLLLTATPAGHDEALTAIKAIVQVTVPLAVLDGPADEGTAARMRPGPAVLSGFGPIPTDTARVLAGHTPGWERVCLDPTTGLPVAVDKYRPTARQKAFLKARDEHCRFPGCRRPAHRCDLDHTVDAAKGGATCICNLAHFCRRHHTLKHHTDWTVRQVGNGTLEWTSPTGRLHRDRPPTVVRFRPDGDDPPPF